MQITCYYCFNLLDNYVLNYFLITKDLKVLKEEIAIGYYITLDVPH